MSAGRCWMYGFYHGVIQCCRKHQDDGWMYMLILVAWISHTGLILSGDQLCMIQTVAMSGMFGPFSVQMLVGLILSDFALYHIYCNNGPFSYSSPSPPSLSRSQHTVIWVIAAEFDYLHQNMHRTHVLSVPKYSSTQDLNISMSHCPGNRIYFILWWSTRGKILGPFHVLLTPWVLLFEWLPK